jgi:3-oxoacyl-[acyl-carrier protein] reductase
MSKLTGKIAVVTGASKGIGAGIAKGLAEAGAAVVVNYASDRAGADKIVSEIKARDGRAVAVQGDVAKAGDVKRLFEETQTAFGAPDILVNNAGVFKFVPIDAVDADEFHRQFDINVLGTLLATQEAARRFGDKGGSVINISSIVAKGAPANASIYAATKGAVDTLTSVLANELGPRHIRVNAIAPGLTETEGTHTAGFVGSDFANSAIASTPLGRIGHPEDIAEVAVFLASDDSRWLTGEIIAASGGLRR